jgi:predicted 3-demethylubiquinone-9 3-methyltransferase (glyoxalase superfamily)
LNGGPQFKFNESVSFQIDCEDQAEVDYYWEKLGEDKDGGRGGESHCGWVKDRFGVSWQVIPKGLNELISGKKEGEGDKVMEEKERRAWSALMGMGKIDIAAMKKEYDGEA